MVGCFQRDAFRSVDEGHMLVKNISFLVNGVDRGFQVSLNIDQDSVYISRSNDLRQTCEGISIPRAVLRLCLPVLQELATLQFVRQEISDGASEKRNQMAPEQAPPASLGLSGLPGGSP